MENENLIITFDNNLFGRFSICGYHMFDMSDTDNESFKQDIADGIFNIPEGKSVFELDYDIDKFKSLQLDAAEVGFDYAIDILKENYDINIELLTPIEIDSPREYNFGGDLAVFKAKFEDKIYQQCIDLANRNKDKFEQYIKENFSSRSGFISFIHNDFDAFITELENEDGTYMLLFLDFLLTLQVGDDTWNEIQREVDEYFHSNYFYSEYYNIPEDWYSEDNAPINNYQLEF